jgi:nickel transport protein
MRTCYLLITASFVLIAACSASAHQIHVFALYDGSAIGGRVYASGGEAIADAVVQVRTPDGRLLGKATTAANGSFTYRPTERCDHVLVVETTDGHRAAFTVGADELPGDLPAASGSPPAAAAPAAGPTTAPVDELDRRIAAAVRRQIAPLRRQIDALAQRRGLLDVIGGIGYLVGLAGVAFFVLGWRKGRSST